MKLLGLNVEDLVALISILASIVGALIWSFKKAFHNVYEKESQAQQELTSKLIDMVDDFKHTQHTLNETMKELQNDLKQTNATMNNHEVRLAVLEENSKRDRSLYNDRKN